MDSNSLILTLLNLKGWGAKKVYDYVYAHELNYEKCVKGLVEELSDAQKIEFKQQLVVSKQTLALNLQNGISACNILDECFHEKLYFKSDKCVFLYYKGNIELLNKKSIAIIGTRTPDEDFVDKGMKAAKYVARKGYVIVSGLALGCDTVAHESALLVNGDTIAVLPSPCDNPQPTSNKDLANRIVENGGLLISEYGTGTPVSKYNYPQRDRIQSLLTSTVLIIQASDGSGTMIATKKSIKDRKDVYAIKGNNLSLVKKYVDVDNEEELNEIAKWIMN